MTTCHDTTPPAELAAGSVLLVGNPNVGKSTLFNRLTGARQHVMNAPGTTVELRVGTWQGPLTDLPGTYSLVARTPDEQVVVDALSVDPDAVAVVLLDATALSRSLYLLAQVGAQRPVVAVLTMLDVARSHGTDIDPGRLSTLLGIPVVALDPRDGDVTGTLAEAVTRACPVLGAPAATAATPLDEAERLFTWVQSVVTELDATLPIRRTRTDAVDRVLLNPWFGVPLFLVVMWGLFQLTTTAAAPLIDLVDRGVQAVAAVARGLIPDGWFEGLLVDGVLVGVGTVLTFLPVLALVYVALALLEDSGYLARAGFLADRWMRVLGLDGRAMLPLVIGFGCNVPAVAATQTLPSARQRVLTGLLVPWTTCAARLPVYILLAGVFFPEHAGTAIFAMYVVSLLLVALGGLVLRRTAFRDLGREPLLLVLPVYQRPRLRAIALSVWTRVRSFAIKAGRIIVITLTLMWALMAIPGEPGGGVQHSLYGLGAQAIAPVFAPAGFDDWHMSAALATGFVAKEVVVGSLAQSYAVDETETGAGSELGDALRATLDESSGGAPAAAALALMVFVLGYAPCLATASEQVRRFGARWTMAGIGIELTVAWLIAVAVFQVGALLTRLL
jgi:ferrous iron transport protein B